MVSRTNALSIYVPKSKKDRRPIERLSRLAKDRDRSVNYLIVEAILQYLDREENRG
jgi:predicted transcriptional regulator